MRKILNLGFILFITAFLIRTYRIYELSEFLGDQGRTGIIIYDALINKSFPLVGPTVLSGQYLGPFFYYFIGPSFIFSNFNPVIPAVFTALLDSFTVLMIFYIGKKIFNTWIAFFSATLYLVSSQLIVSSRTLWEPNIIPFFVVIFILSIYKIYAEKKYSFFLLLGVTSGILIQLHYPNLIFIAIGSIFFFYILVLRKEKYLKTIIKWGILAISGFTFTLLPFLFYEFTHSFKDLKEIVLIFVSRKSSFEIYPPFYQNIADYSSRLFTNILPFKYSFIFYFFLFAIIISPILFNRYLVRILNKFNSRFGKNIKTNVLNFWNLFFFFWFIAGILAMSLYKGVVFNHYLNFLIPVPFFLFAILLKNLNLFIPKKVLILCSLILILLNLQKIDFSAPAKNDFLRTGSNIKEMLSQAKDNPFSFTLISSRSFSDLHYRYFLKTQKIPVEKITDKNYQTLFLICEKEPCITEKELIFTPAIQTMCYEDHCKGNYPEINLKEFKFVTSKKTIDGKIYTLERKAK